MKVWSSRGGELSLGRELGRGGEGQVFTITGDSARVAKIYSPSRRLERREKISAMVRKSSPELSRFVAWPEASLYLDPEKTRFCGFLMPRVSEDFLPAHRIYSPADRSRDLPGVDWRFLIAAAANVGSAFQDIHAHGHVVGDVNHSNILISKKALVRLIDADSIQVSTGSRTFRCEVGVPEFTPPELQGRSLSTVQRTEDHDAFGLAVMIFMLLFMGRHPFSGVHADRPLTLNEAIREGRFAYAGRGSREGRPPGSLEIEAVGDHLAGLFRRAFISTPRTSRPRAGEWVEALRTAQEAVQKCRRSSRHYFLPNGAGCHWCALEESGFEFFRSERADANVRTSQPSKALRQTELDALWRMVLGVGRIEAKDIHKDISEFPLSPVPDPPKPMKAEFAGTGVFLSLFLFLIVPQIAIVGLGLSVTYWVLSAVVNSLAAARYNRLPHVRSLLSLREREQEVLSQLKNAGNQLRQVYDEYRRAWDSVHSSAQAAKTELDKVTVEALREQATEALSRHERAEFLRNALIHEADIRGIGPVLTSELRSFGIETALDVLGASMSGPSSRAKVHQQTTCPTCGSTMVRRRARRGRYAGKEFWGCSRYPGCRGTRRVATSTVTTRGGGGPRLEAVPGIGPAKAESIRNWARGVESRFRPNPDPGRLKREMARLAAEDNSVLTDQLGTLKNAPGELKRVNRRFAGRIQQGVSALEELRCRWDGLHR